MYVTIVKFNSSYDIDIKIGEMLLLKKDIDNKYDDEAIEASIYLKYDEDYLDIDDLYDEDDEVKKDIIVENSKCMIDEYIQVGYVANSVKTVARGTYSAGRLYDKFEKSTTAEVKFVIGNSIIAKII